MRVRLPPSEVPCRANVEVAKHVAFLKDPGVDHPLSPISRSAFAQGFGIRARLQRSDEFPDTALIEVRAPGSQTPRQEVSTVGQSRPSVDDLLLDRRTKGAPEYRLFRVSAIAS